MKFRDAAKSISLSIFILLTFTARTEAARFFCSSGNVTCLIAAVNTANRLPGVHTVNLEPGIYTLQAVDNITNGPNGLPSIVRSIRIEATAETPPTVIERNTAAAPFRIFQVATSGKLVLVGVTLEKGSRLGGAQLRNDGVTLLQNSIVSNNASGEQGSIYNSGTLHVSGSIIVDNTTGHLGGGIYNAPSGNLLVENSTIRHNQSADGGGIFNEGSAVIRNSAIFLNETDHAQAGGGIRNQNSGNLEIINTTIAKNIGSEDTGGAAVDNRSGHVSIINSTIRENRPANVPASDGSGGIMNRPGGTFEIKNTIIAGNIVGNQTTGPDCRGTITSLGNNFIGDPTNCDINLQPSDLTGDPGLGPLTEDGENDAPGRVHYPVLTGSPLINAGDKKACPKKDQLDNPRGSKCEIGAVEFVGSSQVVSLQK